MQRLRRLMEKDLVAHFWISYLLVLTLPVMIIFIGILAAFWSISADIRESNLTKMEHSIQLIDNNLSSLHSMAVQGTSSTSVKTVATFSQVERDNILKYKDGIDILSTILLYENQGVGFISESYLYFNKSQYCFYEGALYKPNIFERYLEKWSIDKEEWLDKIVNKSQIIAQFAATDGKLHYTMPINVKDGQNDGMLVFLLNTDELMTYFDFAKEYGEGALYVADKNDRILFGYDSNLEDEKNITQQEFEQTISQCKKSLLLTYTSEKNGWTYYVLLPNHAIAGKMLGFSITLILLCVVTLGGCMYLSLHQANKLGRPIDHLFDLLSHDQKNADVVKSTEKLGEIVMEIVSSNKELLEEIEESKPLLRKAFFHDLLTLDVTSTKEMYYLAENAGIHINSDGFWVISSRLFSNNDVYDVDEQTLEDVKVIIRTLQRHIGEYLEENVWFYQRNYLSMLILIAGESREKVMKMIEETYAWLLTEYSTESVWGISNKCDNIMNIWKGSEEAESARKCCDAGRQIVEYSASVNEKHVFYFPEMAEEKLRNYLKAGDLNAIKEVLHILKQENLKNRKLTRNGFIKLNQQICDLISSVKKNEQESMPYIMRLNQTIIENEHISGEAYFSCLVEIVTDICADLKQVKGQKRNQLIDSIKQYINENYTNPDLGLASISIHFGISEGYVSLLFKEQTQIGFSDYMEKIRMDKAVELLSENSSNIEGIATMVGYNSVQSFRRAFKRVYGVSPKNYR
ncbi:MAG: AraC family transcriptional regulator [Lachnospiraceae bacterium]|nr:AraC family transcriptional regulator [Lachnospiraceae bacterium]